MMNYIINFFRTITASLLLVVLASCSQDVIDRFESLPPGQYPLGLTVSVEGMKSRADGNDYWLNASEIGVKIGEDSEVGRYEIDTNGNVDIANSANILYWKTTSPATVTAWYPAEPQTGVSIVDQSKLSDFSSIDYLAATAENQSYKNTVDLTFKHQMAKITCILTTGDKNAISEDQVKDAVVTFNGYTVASFVNGELTGSTHGDISPIKHNYTHEALLIPADMTGKELFRIDINVGGYKKTYTYTPTDPDLKGGNNYTYNIKLTRNGLEVEEITAVWNGNDDFVKSNRVPLQVFLPEDAEFIDQLDWDIKLSGNVTSYEQWIENNPDQWPDEWPEGNLYLVDGSTFTITMPVTEEYIMKGFTVSEGVCSVNRVRKVDPDYGPDYHEFTFKMMTETARLEYGLYVQPGDYLYSNGEWRPDFIGEKNDSEGNNEDWDNEIGFKESNWKAFSGYGYEEGDGEWECIGVVFKAGPGVGDSPDNYDMLETIHGYAVALHDAAEPTEIGDWGNDRIEDIGVYPDITYRYDGYKNTQKILQDRIIVPVLDEYNLPTGEEIEIDKIDDRWFIEGEWQYYYWPFRKVKEYNEAVKLPENVSSWYLPSIGQLSDLYYLGVRRERLLMAGGEDFLLTDVGLLPQEQADPWGAKYWSSTQSAIELAWVFRFQLGEVYRINKIWKRYNQKNRSHVRAVLTF